MNSLPFQLYLGDCLVTLKTLPDNSVDSIVTDPPYGLSFMGKKWDYDVPSVDVWVECLRVLKPGAHLLAFAGTRTQHRMAVRIEDAGFEIRDMIAWVYGSGFPKSLDVSKAIDKAAGAEREVVGHGVGRTGKSAQPNGGSTFSDDSYQWPGQFEITAPATDAARQWQGWGTALKPALEPIIVARKPLAGTVAENVLAHGTGALNIDGCRVDAGDGRPLIESKSEASLHAFGNGPNGSRRAGVTTQGRWPANLIHDGSDEVLAAFPQAQGHQGTTGKRKQGTVYGAVTQDGEGVEPRGDTGSAARFFYCAKTSKSERGAENNHPTVKPVALMRHLLRLVTPPGGVPLDPFVGSGSTGVAAIIEGFKFIGIEREAQYLQIASSRITSAYLKREGW